MNTTTKIRIQGVEYEIDPSDLTWGEMETLEQETGKPIGKMDTESATTLLVLAWLARRRKEPLVTLDDMRALPMDAIEVVDEPDPTPAAEGGEASTVDTTGSQS